MNCPDRPAGPLAPRIRRALFGLLLAAAVSSLPARAEPDIPVLRTPDERFAGLPAYPFEPRSLTVDPFAVRMHYVDTLAERVAHLLLSSGA